MIDAHAHLQFEAFLEDAEKVIKDSQNAGVTTIVNVGTQISSSIAAVEFAHKYSGLFAIVGIHPHHADKLDNNWEKELEKVAKDEKVLAIGEIGLDYYSYKSNGIVDPKIQKDVFERQIEIAHILQLPLQIHTRLAWDDVYEVLKYHKNSLPQIPGMFHCFSGSTTFLKKVLDLGFYVGFDGNVTYPGIPRGEDTALKDLAQAAPLDRILVETDSPYLTPIPFRGQRNSPKNAIIVAEYLADLKQVDIQRFTHQIAENFMSCFQVEI